MNEIFEKPLSQRNRSELIDLIYKLLNRIYELENSLSLGWGTWKLKKLEPEEEKTRN